MVPPTIVFPALGRRQAPSVDVFNTSAARETTEKQQHELWPNSVFAEERGCWTLFALASISGTYGVTTTISGRAVDTRAISACTRSASTKCDCRAFFGLHLLFALSRFLKITPIFYFRRYSFYCPRFYLLVLFPVLSSRLSPLFD